MRFPTPIIQLLSLAAWFAPVDKLPAQLPQPPAKHNFEIGSEQFLIDGKKLVIRCGEMHFARIPPEYWRHRLKMAKAMGLNTVCAYLFWNMHESDEGKFDWTGWRDAAEFCRIAQEEGLWVIVRPGPYACAEWEMGGLPWWLLKHDGIGLRSKDPKFLDPATRYLKEVGRVLAPLQVTNGGPILMVQVENEYGFFGKDAEYMGELRQALIDGGFDVPLFACNPTGAIGNGFREDLFQVVNFGPGASAKAFEALRKYPENRPADVRRILSRVVRHVGRGHRYSNVGQFHRRPRIHARRTTGRSASTWRTAALPSACGRAPTGRSSRIPAAMTTTRRSARPAGRHPASLTGSASSVRQVPAARRDASRRAAGESGDRNPGVHVEGMRPR